MEMICAHLYKIVDSRKHAELHRAKLSIRQGNDAFAVTLAMDTEL